MKTLNVKTDKGVKEGQLLKILTVTYEGTDFRFAVARYLMDYMGGPEVETCRVVHFSTGAGMPVKSKGHRQTLKSYISEVTEEITAILNRYGLQGANKEFAKYETINCYEHTN